MGQIVNYNGRSLEVGDEETVADLKERLGVDEDSMFVHQQDGTDYALTGEDCVAEYVDENAPVGFLRV
jgi:hypothetical protein